MNNLARRLLLCLVSLSLLFAGPQLYAQGIITGSISGTLTDTTGAVITGAAVKATNKQSGLIVTGTSDSKGGVFIENLPIGSYTVSVISPGFAELKVSGVEVTTGNIATLGTQTLSVNSKEDVTVNTATNLLETAQAQITTTIESQEITDLPTGGGLDRLVLLVPGVVRTLGNNYANTNGTGLSSNGLRGRSNNFEIDGQANNDNSISGPQIFFRNEDALQELQLVTNNFSAQYGKNAGSVVNYITKQGTNAFHGTGFENYVGSWGSSLLPSQKNGQFGFCYPGQVTTAALPCSTPVVPRVTANEYGGTFGGPVFRDKLFFFGGTLWRKVTNGASPVNSGTLTPTPNGLSQLQAAFPGNGFVAGLTNSGPYSITAGNPIVGATQQIPVCAQASAAVCPAGSPTAEFATITRLLPSKSQDQQHIGRLDYQPTVRDRFFLRYIYEDAPTFVSGGVVSSGAYYNTFNTTHSAGADWTHTFSPRWVNQVRYGFQQSKLVFGGGGYPTCTTTSLASCPANISIGATAYSAANTGATGQASSLSSLGVGLATNIPQGRIVKVTQVQDNATVSLGKHAITFGGEYDYQNSPNTFLPSTSGAFTFQSFNYALAGVATLQLANGKPTIPFREPDVAGYFQDDWRIKPELTLNLGLRWEFFKQGINVLHDISLANQTGPNPIWDTSLPLSLTTFPQIPQSYRNFEPRLGFAYNPKSEPGLVIRGGFSAGVDPQFYNIFLNSYTSAPVVNTGVINCDGVTIKCLPANGITNALVHAQDDRYNPTGAGVNPGSKIETQVSPNFRNPYVLNYTLGLQQEFGHSVVGEIRYVGNHGVDQFQTIDGSPNVAAAPPTSAVPTAQNYKTLAQAFPTMFPASSYCTTPGSVGLGHTDCNRIYVSSRGNTAFSKYNALQTSLKFANYHGLSGSVAYTWSRAVDNTSEVFSGGSSGGNTIAVSQNPFNTNSAEHGVSGESYPNVVAAGLVYKPSWYGEQRGVVGKLLGGYSVNTVWTYNSGQPYTPYQTTKLSVNGAALAKIPTANQGQALYSFGDYYYNSGVLGADTERPILSNPLAPAGSVGINGGPGVGYLNIATGASISPSQVKWLYNNQYEAEARNNPYPGVGRNTLRGNTVNELDMSVFKTLRMTERVSTQFRINVYNLPNRLYLGNPDPVVGDANATHKDAKGNLFASFENYLNNGGMQVGTPFGKGGRNIQIGGKIIF